MPLDPFSLWLFSDRAGTSVYLSAQDFSSHQLELEESCVCTLLEELHFSSGLLVAANSMKSRGLWSDSPAPLRGMGCWGKPQLVIPLSGF